MNINVKKIFVSVIGLFTAFSLNFVSAERPVWHGKKALVGGRLYRAEMDKRGNPKIMIVGAGRGELRFGKKVFAEKYDEYAYGSQKNDYYLVDACRTLLPDCVCDATTRSMQKLGISTWDSCVLEFLPHKVCMDGALKNAISLVKSGGKVYMNAVDFFNPGYNPTNVDLPERFWKFRDYFAGVVRVNGKKKRPDFSVELSKRPDEVENFFRYVYGIGDGVASIRLVSRSDANWPSKSQILPNFYVWEITNE